MAYEYENKLKNRLLDLEFDTWEETAQFEREYREMEHVYEKAKTLDKIIDIIKVGRNLGVDGDSEIILRAIEHELEYLEADYEEE